MTPPRRKRRSQRAERRTVLLVTNGRVTENAYLQQLCRRVDRDRVSAKVKVINGDPLTVVKELSGPRSDLSEYKEVWIVVDHDGQDRHDFLAKCRRLSSKRTVVHGVISVPCFEVWLNAHYDPVKNYRNQADAQAHYLELTGLSKKTPRCSLTTSPGMGPHRPWSGAICRRTASLSLILKGLAHRQRCPTCSAVLDSSALTSSKTR